MIEININKINKNYGFEKILDNFSLELKTNEKIALIGPNGSGKTTLLKMIIGSETPDSGTINIRKGAKVGYLCQIPSKEETNIKAYDVYVRGVRELITLENKINEFVKTMTSNKKDINTLSRMQEEFRIKEGYKINEKINRIKNGFKLTDELLNTEYNKLSGGEKTIINLASLILSEPEILLLDEPTNHLDIETLEWFENYLKEYKGAIIIVSHDRYFLDNTVNKIISIEKGTSEVYHGNYSYYLKESEKRLMLEFNSYKNQQKQIKAIEEAIARLKEWGKKADNPIFFRRAESMQKRLDRMEIIEKPKEKKELPIKLVTNKRSGNEVLTLKNFDLEIGSKELLINSNMNIYYQDRICLMGKNGSGKTTLIKNILNNTHNNIKIGTNINIGYIPQEIRFDNEELTIYEHMRKIFVGTESELRSKLYQFYFGDETINKKLKTLSGGEKVRIKLLELILKNANFLILDEPTNHIDIDTKEILETSLLEFEGTILFISHDRYFINKIATRIVRIESKRLINYEGNYESIKFNEPIQIKEEKIEKKINLKGSNRLNEFIKDAKVEEVSIGCSNTTVYRIQKKSKVFFLKVSDHLSQESIRLDYLSNKIIVPEKVFYEKYNGKSYILTKALKGKMLCDDYYINNPLVGIKIIVEAFNAIYNIDYTDCIIDETIDTKIKRIEDRFNTIKEENIKKEIIDRFHTKENILKYLKGNKPKQIIGFTHGDMSLPNIFAENNHFSGLLDVSECGISDIYFDLVICEISIEKNYGIEYIDTFYNELGIEKDEQKSEYYRILMSL